MRRLYIVDEVLVRRLNGLVWVSFGEETTVGGHEAVVFAAAQLDVRQLRLDLVNGRLLIAHPVAALACHSVVRCAVLFVFGQTNTDFEVCHLILRSSVRLLLPASSLAEALHLLETSLRVVHSVVFAKDEVSASEFGDSGLALRLSVKLTA